MVQIHSPRPTLSRTRKLWFFVCSAVDDSVDSRILEVHRARVLASLVRSSFKLGDAGRFPLPRRCRLRNSFGAQAQRFAEAANGGHWTWLSYRDAQGPEEVRRASVKRIVIEETPKLRLKHAEVRKGRKGDGGGQLKYGARRSWERRAGSFGSHSRSQRLQSRNIQGRFP